MLSLSLNGRTFFQLSDIIEHIQDYPVGLERVELYCDAVEQTAAIFEIGSAFASDLMKALTVMLSRLLYLVDGTESQFMFVIEKAVWHGHESKPGTQ